MDSIFQFSKRGDNLVTNGDKMKLWDTKNGSLIAQLGNHLNYSAVFNNDGNANFITTKNDIVRKFGIPQPENAWLP